jgi:hypothetical protein
MYLEFIELLKITQLGLVFTQLGLVWWQRWRLARGCQPVLARDLYHQTSHTGAVADATVI